METEYILLILLGYFAVLVGLSFYTARKANNDSFFLGNKSSKWYLVSFGMIGASISGVTFISVPGQVVYAQFSYMQVVLGYLVGYIFIALVLMPIYYKMNLTSIYTYLEHRFGKTSNKTGAAIFLVSRLIGSSARILLVAQVLQNFIFVKYGIPFEVSLFLSVFLIWVCTFKGGMKTIVITDTFQTFFLVGALILSVFAILQHLPEGISFNGINGDKEYTKAFFFEDFYAKNHFIKMFLGGLFTCIAMTGLDQDLMQKNLTCKNIKEAQKNMLSFSVVLVFINLLFLLLGAVLYTYSEHSGISLPMNEATGKIATDSVYPQLAFGGHLAGAAAVFFILGLTAATYASADSAMTSLTTSVCIDFIGINKYANEKRERVRKMTHLIVAGVIYVTIYILFKTTTRSAIDNILFLAGLTYGPLIGLFMFGIFTKRMTNEKLVPIICLISPILSWLLSYFSSQNPEGYQFGWELILVNGIITFTFLFVTGKKNLLQTNTVT